MSTYIIKIPKKYLNRIIRYHIQIKKIRKIDNDYLLYLNEEEYQKILKYQKIFNLKFIDYKGLIRYKNIFKNNMIFFIMFLISIFYIIWLSNLIFKIEIKTNNREMQKLVREELQKNGIDLYKLVKSFNRKETIKKKILNDNKDKLEWLEITRHGSVYIVNVEERIIKNIDTNNQPCDIVASKNAIILEIKAKNGSIVKKLNDYVKKDEVIVSGNIVHKEEVVNKVKAEATIYGETWYKVHVSYPISYYEKIYTNNNSKRFSFKLFNKKIVIGKQYKREEINENILFTNRVLPIKFSFDNVKELELIDDLYTVDEAVNEGIKLASQKLLDTLEKDSRILDQKKLKIIVNNSTIDMDIFFKVYENITKIKRIEE